MLPALGTPHDLLLGDNEEASREGKQAQASARRSPVALTREVAWSGVQKTCVSARGFVSAVTFHGPDLQSIPSPLLVFHLIKLLNILRGSEGGKRCHGNGLLIAGGEAVAFEGVFFCRLATGKVWTDVLSPQRNP